MALSQEQIDNCFLHIDSADLGDGPRNAVDSVGKTLKFSNMPPDLGSSKSAQVEPVHILGRANPLWIYSYSGERSWNLELKFFSLLQSQFDSARVQNVGSLEPAAAQQINNNDVKKQVLDKVNWCEALVYPIYKQSISRGLPELTFVFGDMLNVKVICTDVQSSFPGPWYIKNNNTVGYPMFGIVNLTLKQVGGRGFSHLDVRGNIHNGAQSNL